MNGKIVGGVVFIGGMAAVRSFVDHRPITPVIIGAYILLFLLAIAEFFGIAGDTFATAFVGLAVVVTLVDVVPWPLLFSAMGIQK